MGRGFETRFMGEPGDGVGRSRLHLLIDDGGAAIERAAEQKGEAEDVVDLVGIVRATSADQRIGACLFRQLRHDLGHGIAECQDQRVWRHILHHLRFQSPSLGQTHKDIRPRHDSAKLGLVTVLGKSAAPAVNRIVALLGHQALGVGDPDVFPSCPDGDQHVHTGNGRGPRPRRDDLDLADVLLDQPHGVDDGCSDDDRRAVLVVMKDRNVHALAQGFLDLEAFGRLDVLEVYATKGRFQRRDDLDEALGILFVDLDIDRVDARKLLEQDCLAFHHRLGRQRANIAQAEDRRAVGNHRDQIALGGVAIGVERIGRDLLAGRRDAWGVGQRQVPRIGQWLDRRDFQLAGPRELVEMQRGFAKAGGLVVGHRSLPCSGAPHRDAPGRVPTRQNSSRTGPAARGKLCLSRIQSHRDS